ncbi:MAG: YIP1 family protein [Saccharofermentanales bacterium]
MKRVFLAISMVLIIFMSMSSPILAIDLEGTAYVIENTRKVPIPDVYEVVSVIDYLGSGYGSLNSPDDLFITGDDVMYVADTGNNRIVKMQTDGKILGQFMAEDADGFNAPKGVFVMANGSMLIADSNNQRVVHLSAEGHFIEEFTKPQSDLLNDSVTFEPSKVYLSPSGYLYMIKSQQFLTIDTNNRFRGFVGANEVPFSIKNMLIRMFASAEQKRNITKVQPAAYSNFLISDDGIIYATSLGDKNQIKAINSVGKNTYTGGFYGEYSINSINEVLPPAFVDLAVDKNGILSAIDTNSSKIYQYDIDGNLLCVFAGTGDSMGYFALPSSIAIDSAGYLYVLDKVNNNIQVFKPTGFISNIHKAIKYYHDGDYENAKTAWIDVLKTDSNYPLALKGLGSADWKSGDYLQSMSEFRKALDTQKYSQAFDDYMHSLLRKNFTVVVLAIGFSIIMLVWFTIFMKRKADNMVLGLFSDRRYFSIKLALLTIFHPFDSFYFIKRDRNVKKYVPVVILLALTLAVKLSSIYVVHFPLASVLPQDANLLIEAAFILIPILSWTLSVYGITTILGGEMKIGEAMTVNAYSLLPYILFTLPLAGLSNLLSSSSQYLFQSLNAAVLVWVVILLITAVKEMNSYTVGQTAGICILGLIGVALIWSICLLLATLTIQFDGFIRSVMKEITVQGIQ